jgi:hypothetical protein
VSRARTREVSGASEVRSDGAVAVNQDDIGA